MDQPEKVKIDDKLVSKVCLILSNDESADIFNARPIDQKTAFLTCAMRCISAVNEGRPTIPSSKVPTIFITVDEADRVMIGDMDAIRSMGIDSGQAWIDTATQAMGLLSESFKELFQ